MPKVTGWPQGIFEPSKYTLESLEGTLLNTDFGIFVLGPDDILRLRKTEVSAARDNVIFELGLFIGRVGKERNFIVCPSDIDNFHLPTDLLGLTPVTFDSKRTDGNLEASLGPACHDIRQAINRTEWRINTKTENPNIVTENEAESAFSDSDCISLLETWLRTSSEAQEFHAIKLVEVDKELGLPIGTAKRFVVEAAKRFYWRPVRDVNQTVTFEVDADALPRQVRFATSISRDVDW